MLAAIPLYEMAETLCVLAGSNASNAARHFSRQSYDVGDIASAILWTSLARVLDRMVSAAQEPEEALAMPSAPPETLAAVTELADNEFKATGDFHHPEYAAAADDQGVPERPRTSGGAPQTDAGETASNPLRLIWPRNVPDESRPMAA